PALQPCATALRYSAGVDTPASACGVECPPMRAALTFLCVVTVAAAAGAATPPRPFATAAWAPKPISVAPYPPGVKPWVKLSELKAKHRSNPNWRELVVDDGRLTGEYVAAAPGTKVEK